MSKKIDNLHRVIQDLESRYGEDDADVRQLRAELNVLKALKESARGMRRTVTPGSRTLRTLNKGADPLSH